jgi:hypothetical protein
MRASAIAVLALLAQSAAAQWSGWDYDHDRPKEEFKELELKLPPYPADANLVAFEAGAASAHRFYIDSKALSIGEDGVVRYTLVVRTAGGATNVTYEGIRCDLRQVKIYASGRPDRTWAGARNPQWTRITTQQVNIHHGVLFGDYFCAGKTNKTPVAGVEEALQLMRYGEREKPRE